MNKVIPIFVLCFLASTLQAQQLAFPTAEGFGRFAKGGRGGDVYHVTTRNDSGHGSLRDGIHSATGPRTIVFDVSGTIELKSNLVIDKPFITIAGQTAPGDGITLKGRSFVLQDTHDIIVRYIRIRYGDKNKENDSDAIRTNGISNVIFDHISATWGVDAIHDLRGEKFTLQWSMYGECLNKSLHEKGEHAMLGSFRDVTNHITIHHNIFFSSRNRHPTLGGGKKTLAGAVVDFRNNVNFNWRGPTNFGNCKVNVVSNYYRPGLSTDVESRPFRVKAEYAETHSRGYLSGNYIEGNKDFTDDNYSAVTYTNSGGYGSTTREKFARDEELVTGKNKPITHTAQQAYQLVLQNAGASIKRDAVDVRIIAGIKDRTNRLIDSQDEVGGWPQLMSTNAPVDVDRDGMPDDWESTHGLNPNNPADRNDDLDKNGYTNLEEYLNGITIFASPLQVTGDLNNDGKVDFTDFITLAGNFGKEGEPNADCAALIGDLNCDSKVDFTDFITLAGNFGKVGETESEDQKHLEDLQKETSNKPAIAFPGAEGYGRFAQGGRGGDVYIVTNLSDDGVGSLRYGIENMDGPRTIVFAVSGTIELDSAIKITDSHLTIAGQTAPGDGICIKHYGLDIQNVNNIIIRYIRIRMGDQNKGTSSGEECLTVKNSNDIIFDHISAGWGIDSIQDTRDVGNYTLQWSIFGETLHESIHYKGGSHSKLGSFRDNTGNLSIHHNLLHSTHSRHPSIGGGAPTPDWAIADFRNNLIYNSNGQTNMGAIKCNVINNYYKDGPNTGTGDIPFRIKHKAENGGPIPSGFMSGNLITYDLGWTADNYSAVQYVQDGVKYTSYSQEIWELPGELVFGDDRPVTHSLEDAYNLILLKAGASLSRDACDDRIVNEVLTNTGQIPDSQDDVGGWPTLNALPAPTDSDLDGMPDVWEAANGLNANNGSDRNDYDLDPDYTNLEVYINGLISRE